MFLENEAAREAKDLAQGSFMETIERRLRPYETLIVCLNGAK